jgi:hypothetical protein
VAWRHLIRYKLNLLIVSSFFRFTVCYECLWYYYQALQFGAKGPIVLISCDFFARKSLQCLVLLRAVVSCALNQSSDPVCGCEIGAAVGAPGEFQAPQFACFVKSSW